MTGLPPDLRDRAVRTLEEAIAERDRLLAALGARVASMQSEVARLEADLADLREAADTQRRDLTAGKAALEASRIQALEDIQRISAQMELQHSRMIERLREAEEVHRRAVLAEQSRLDELVRRRLSAEDRSRRGAQRLLDESKQQLNQLQGSDADAMDLLGERQALRVELGAAETLVEDEVDRTEELVAAATAVAVRVYGLVTRVQMRRTQLSALRDRFSIEADWLETIIRGPIESETEDRRIELAHMRLLIAQEADQMHQMINAHVRTASQQLRRWNGHGAIVARIEAIRDRLAAEARDAWGALPAAERHEAERYNIEWFMEDLRLKFGFVRPIDVGPRGAWSNPKDVKSVYTHYLESSAGLLLVRLPWHTAGNDIGRQLVTAEHGNTRLQRLFPTPASSDVLLVGSLRERWSMLNEQFSNPAWSPIAGSSN